MKWGAKQGGGDGTPSFGTCDICPLCLLSGTLSHYNLFVFLDPKTNFLPQVNSHCAQVDQIKGALGTVVSIAAPLPGW